MRVVAVAGIGVSQGSRRPVTIRAFFAGTEFVGRSFVEEALSRGARVTVFNRGTHPPPAGVTALRGDRTVRDGLSALEQGRWDVVVDTWSWAPSAVRWRHDLDGPPPQRSDRPPVGLSSDVEAAVLARAD